jgi:hypothetical protein
MAGLLERLRAGRPLRSPIESERAFQASET